tara:strand:- start:1427 stop:1831 length:405 start_codon:yes stop_codon:yes gene_type:complete
MIASGSAVSLFNQTPIGNTVTLYKANKPIKILSDFIRSGKTYGDTQRTDGSTAIHSRVFSHDAITMGVSGNPTQHGTLSSQKSGKQNPAVRPRTGRVGLPIDVLDSNRSMSNRIYSQVNLGLRKRNFNNCVAKD